MGSISASLPYLSSDGVMRTLSDRSKSPVVELGILRTTVDTLSHSIRKNYEADSGITDMEMKGRMYRSLQAAGISDSLTFSEAVCNWGRGARVFGNLQRHYPDRELGERIHYWLMKVAELEPREAVTLGLEIKGLRISFVSKHLRHLEPERFAVLDEVLSLGLGYGMNPAGYQLFIKHLSSLKDELSNMGEPARNIAEIESGIFLLARQHVRSS